MPVTAASAEPSATRAPRYPPELLCRATVAAGSAHPCASIESYKEMIGYIGRRDPTTRRLLESILAKEEEHAEELSSMLRNVAPAGNGSSA